MNPFEPGLLPVAHPAAPNPVNHPSMPPTAGPAVQPVGPVPAGTAALPVAPDQTGTAALPVAHPANPSVTPHPLAPNPPYIPVNPGSKLAGVIAKQNADLKPVAEVRRPRVNEIISVVNPPTAPGLSPAIVRSVNANGSLNLVAFLPAGSGTQDLLNVFEGSDPGDWSW